VSFNDIIGMHLRRVGVDTSSQPAQTSKLLPVLHTAKELQEDPAFIRDRGESAIGAGLRNSCWVPGHSARVANFGKLRGYNSCAAIPYRESCMPCLNQYVKFAAGIHKQGNQDREPGVLKCGTGLQIQQFVENHGRTKNPWPFPAFAVPSWQEKWLIRLPD
jgi:hypothetical protein